MTKSIPLPGPNQELLTVIEAAAYCRVSKSFLDKARVYGDGPLFIRLGIRKIGYRTADLDRWITDRSFRSTSEYVRRPSVSR